jgi:cation transport regulator ChaB
MRAKEFINEAKKAKISKRHQQSTKGLNTYTDAEKANSDYTMYRISMAVACADGKNPVNMDQQSWVGKKKTAHPYTKEEQDMLKHAYKVAGATYKDLNKGDMESKELDSTHTQSPMMSFKGYKK